MSCPGWALERIEDFLAKVPEPQRPPLLTELLDFGLARASREQGLIDLRQDKSASETAAGTSLTRTGEMLGTPDFMAPEQIVDAQAADIRADIYSLGCTLHFLLSGRAPFQGTVREVLRAHRFSEAPRLDTVRAEVPAELAELVARMMAKAPNNRPQAPAAVAAALTPFFKTGASAFTPTDRVALDATQQARDPGVAGPAPANRGAEHSARAVSRTKTPWRRPVNANDSGEAAAAASRQRAPTFRWRLTLASIACLAVMLLCAIATYRIMTDHPGDGRRPAVKEPTIPPRQEGDKVAVAPPPEAAPTLTHAPTFPPRGEVPAQRGMRGNPPRSDGLLSEVPAQRGMRGNPPRSGGLLSEGPAQRGIRGKKETPRPPALGARHWGSLSTQEVAGLVDLRRLDQVAARRQLKLRLWQRASWAGVYRRREEETQRSPRQAFHSMKRLSPEAGTVL
jgi:hypothetical protein